MPDVQVSKHRMMTGYSALCAVPGCGNHVPKPEGDGFISPNRRHLCPDHQDWTLVVYDHHPVTDPDASPDQTANESF
jgi:hypothetical protein